MTSGSCFLRLFAREGGKASDDSAAFAHYAATQHDIQFTTEVYDPIGDPANQS